MKSGDPVAYRLDIGDAKTKEFICITDHWSMEDAQRHAMECISCFSRPAKCYCYTITPIYD